MTKVMPGQVLEAASDYSTDGRPMRLGSYTYLPAPGNTETTKGVLVKGGLPITLEVTEGILQKFMETMISLEQDISRRWVSSETWFSLSSAE